MSRLPPSRGRRTVLAKRVRDCATFCEQALRRAAIAPADPLRRDRDRMDAERWSSHAFEWARQAQREGVFPDCRQ